VTSFLAVLFNVMMSFKFRHLCGLLQSLDDNRIKKKATSARGKNADIPIINSWFNKHVARIPRHGAAAVAFLSCLFPERRADRAYNIQEKRLEKIIGRILMLGTSRLTHLSSWRTPNGADFAQTVQNVMSEAEFPRPGPEHEVTLEEIDVLFDRIAAVYSGSSPELRIRITDPIAAHEALASLFCRLQSNEAKWLIRMFLKRYTPVELPERLIMRQFHFLLPEILSLQNCLTAATRCLDELSISRLCRRPQHEEHERAIRLEAAPYLKPQVGTMIQRSSYYKARSIKHCCDMVSRRRISVERKYDGEYCQVHIDISKGKECIKIFSKSGKDSTADRVRLHGAIANALKLGKKDCTVKKQCILEGELLIWHEKEQRILPFEKIRKHVTRNGRFLGNNQDSPRDLNEKVMIMFYDLLLYDDLVCVNESLEQRRSRLRSLVRRVQGQAELGYREKINFASSDAKSMIRRAFAKGISRGWEGFVLKGCDDPYFSLAGSPPCIKLKKDYITGLGDMADLAVIGGRREARDEQALNIGRLSWTTFHLGCLDNRDEVHRFSAKPRFRFVGVVSHANKTLSPDRTRLLNDLGEFERLPYASCRAEMEVISDQNIDPPTELFKNPFVVEVVGGGFERPANVTYHCLRFPRITKIHEDRSWSDIMSFDQLQELANNELTMAANEDSQADREWIEKLIGADPRPRSVPENSVNSSACRDSDSDITVSATLSGRRSPISPLLVRIETQEMAEQERDERDLLSSVEQSSNLSPAIATTSLKRKSERQEQITTANTSPKRLRLSGQHTITDVSNGSGYETSQVLLHRPQPRRPLLEIQNPSGTPDSSSIASQSVPELSSDRRQYNPKQRFSPLSKAKGTPAVSTLQGEIPTSLPSTKGGTTIAQSPLSTPPTSSADEGQNGSTGNMAHGGSKNPIVLPPRQVREQQNLRVAGPHGSPRDEQQRKSVLSVGILQGSSSMIFLCPAIARRISTEQHDFTSNFATVKASFTFSREVFLERVRRTLNMSHIAIIHVTSTRKTGHEVAAFHRCISRQLRDDRLMGEGNLLFFDWKFLHHLGSNELSISTYKPHFGGCLAWKSGSDACGKRSWELRDIWNWKDVMDLVECMYEQSSTA
jgi:DNA ligase 4